MVASVCARAAAVGVHVLHSGGNAFDAALAVAAMEWLTLPGYCGLGGDTFAVLYDAGRDRMLALNGSGVAGARARRELYAGQGLEAMPLTGWHAASVPGTPDACVALNREFGTRPLAELLAPALAAAEAGVVVSATMNEEISSSASKLGAFPASTSAFLPGGSPPQAGERLALPALAKSIRTLAEEAAEPFYSGAIAKEIISACEEADGPFAAADFGRP